MVFVGSHKQLGFIPWLPTYPARGGYGPGATPLSAHLWEVDAQTAGLRWNAGTAV